MTRSIDDIPMQNSSLVSIDVLPLKKARLSFQTFPGETNNRGEQYDLVFTQITNFELKIEKLPCNLKSIRMLTESVFLKNAENDLVKISARIPSSDLVHYSISFDCGSFDIVARDNLLLKTWSV